MSLLLPLGLLGLLSIIILLIIYLIRPNYQQKYVSSTFVWRLSLKYRRKKLPTSKLRNILLIICQVLILILAALILSKPVHMFLSQNNANEVVAIIDSSASMRTETAGETRYERAVNKVKSLAKTTFEQEGTVSVIVANKEASYLVERVDSTNSGSLESSLDDLVSNGLSISCSYGTSDINKAITLSENILADNPNAKIYLYTDATYSYVPSSITLVSVNEEGEWNAAVLNAYVEMNDNYYDIIVDVASYGRDMQLGINVEVQGVNASEANPYGSTINLDGSSYQVTCEGDQTKRVIFKCGGINDLVSSNTEYFDIDNYKFYSYTTIQVSIDEDDNYDLDDKFIIYGGTKETIKIQYASPTPNTFINGILYTLANNLRSYYNIEITECKDGNPAVEGFDFYIFEHNVPNVLPVDGVVFIEDPDNSPANGGYIVNPNPYLSNRIPLPLTQENDTHPLMTNIVADRIEVTKYKKLLYVDDSYQTLISCDNNPIVLVRNVKNSKIVLMNLDIHYSNLVLRNDFIFFMLNMLDYFFPTIVSNNSCQVYDNVTLNTRGETMLVRKDKDETEFKTFPATFEASIPGTYEITQVTDFGVTITENVYVSVPKSESNIYKSFDTMTDPYANRVDISLYDDLVFYFAIALVAFILLEWWLKNRDNA